MTERNWTHASAENHRAVDAFVAEAGRVPAADWLREPEPGKWSAAEVALHVCQSYEFGRDAARGGAGMRLRMPRVVAWLARTVVLPRLLDSERFPRSRSPREVRPDGDEARSLSREATLQRLQRVAGEAIEALRAAAESNPHVRVTHAYFGPLPPYDALRFLSAHTRHHTGDMARLR